MHTRIFTQTRSINCSYIYINLSIRLIKVVKKAKYLILLEYVSMCLTPGNCLFIISKSTYIYLLSFASLCYWLNKYRPVTYAGVSVRTSKFIKHTIPHTCTYSLRSRKTEIQKYRMSRNSSYRVVCLGLESFYLCKQIAIAW